MDAYISWIKTLKLKYGLNAIIMSVDYRYVAGVLGVKWGRYRKQP